jgi:hypothetical protein
MNSTMHWKSSEPPACLECLTEEGLARATKEGAPLCARCADEYYIECSECRGLIAVDDATQSDGLAYCIECLERLADPEGEIPGDEQVAALVREFIELNAQSKAIETKLEEVKDKLKRVAEGRPREGNAVLLGEGDAMAKCRFSARTSYNSDRLLALEAEVGEELIDTLFERKITFKANDDSLDVFLADDDPQYAAARNAILEAAESKTTLTLTPIANKAPKTNKKGQKKA